MSSNQHVLGKGTLVALTVKDLNIGEGTPKIIVPVMGKSDAELVEGIAAAAAAGADCVEWRADVLPELACAPTADTLEWLATLSHAAKEACGSALLLFTLRTTSQGGNSNCTTESYISLLTCAIESEAIDLVDVEINQGDLVAKGLIRCAHEHNVAVIGSYHNFRETPSEQWMVGVLDRAHRLGADIPKLAVMPESKQDTLRLLAATEEVTNKRNINPVITMAMGSDGAISRLTGEVFGSAMTFASLEEASAPGQVSLEQTRAAITALHEALFNTEQA